MTNQLILLDTQPDWRLDERTRQVGREGLARARAALQAGLRSPSPAPSPEGGSPPGATGRRAAGRPAPARSGATRPRSTGRRPAKRQAAGRRPAA